ncbi:MAG: O-antigen ligase family protein [candidate division WOR-3 bacterium]
MLNALKFRINQILFLSNFLLFLLFYFFYIYLLSETQVKIIYVIKLLIFLIFVLILLIGNFFKNLILLLPLSLLFKVSFNINYAIFPQILKKGLPVIVIPFKLFNIFVLIFLFILILYLLSGGRLKEKVPLFNLLLLLSLIFFLSSIWSIKKDYAVVYSTLFFINIFYYFIGYFYIKTERDLKILLLIFLLFISFNIFISIFQYFLPGFPLLKFWRIEGGLYYWSQRSSGVFYHSNSSAAFMVISSILTLSFILYSENKLVRRFLIFILFLTIFTTFLTLSRAGYLSLFFSFFVYFFFYLLKTKKIKNLFLFLVLSFLLTLSFILIIKILSPSIYLRFQSIFWGKRDISIWTRTLFWETCIKIFLEKPLTGIGIGQFAFLNVSQIHLHAHNVFLNLLAETGLPGFILFLIIIFKIFKFLFNLFLKTEKKEIYLITGLITGWITIIFQLTFDYFWFNAITDMEIKFFFIFLLLTFLIPKIYLKRTSL